MIRGVLNKGIELVLELEPELGTVEADPRQLEQILLNLAANARDAMPSGGLLIIRTWNNSGSEKYVGLSVADTGHGMDEATLSRIFEPFFTTKPEGKGTGLGLATVYGTVRQSRGQISVESKVGKGATFRILLPRTKEAPKTEMQLRANAIPADGKTVLLIEDNADVQQVLARGLEQEGYIVITASNGREAIELLRLHRERFSVIVTDLIMPEMGGIAVGQWLREAGFATPVVYATGYHQDLENAQLPMSAGLLLKPFGPTELAAAIRRATANRRE
jgi:CheY-like chemotaxis protein